jgi:riboflavin kinase/FMN adenylyltransferase
MHVFNSIESLTKVIGVKSLNMALGNFDGVHLGHQRLIKVMVESAKLQSRQSVVVTFDPHPLQYFGKSQDFKKIDSPTIRRSVLASLGVDALLELKFDEGLAHLSAENFLQMLAATGSLRQISVGVDFRFGKGRLGDVQYLSQFCEENGIEAIIVEPVHVGDLVASSSQVRNWLRQGDVESAAVMLGRSFMLRGAVVHGQKVGRTIGFPTANISCHDQLIPGAGVYAGTLRVVSELSSQLLGNNDFPCVINIGSRPTLAADSKKETTVEAHIFAPHGDFDLYEQTVELKFISRLRDEKKFADLEALKRQIAMDIETAKKKLKDVVSL